MPGGLMQLVAYGAQDVYLTGNPQITHFKTIYRRHTNFSVEPFDLPIETAKPGARVSIEMVRNADLATKAYVRIPLPTLKADDSGWAGKLAWVRRLGHALIKNVVLKIGGGTEIDKHYGTWMDIWYELTHREGQARGYENMIGDIPELTELKASQVPGGHTLFIPLLFWFCRNYGGALPLIALQYHPVRVDIEFEDISRLVVYSLPANGAAPTFTNISFNNSGLLIDYVYLDSEERRRFAQVGHEYLIEQLQVHPSNIFGSSNQASTQTFTPSFNHPCKEVITAHRLGHYSGALGSTFLGYTHSTAKDAWDVELLRAAERLAMSMIDVDDVAGNATPSSVLVTIPGNTTVSTQVINGTTYTFYLEDADANDSVFSIITEPLVAGSFNLASRLKAVSVVLKVATVGTPNTVSLNRVSVSSHEMTVEDLSVPLSEYVDTRKTGKLGDVKVVQPFNYGLRLDGKGNIVHKAKIVLNGTDRFNDREGNYFNFVQPWQHHTRTPADGINVYSFSLHPEQHQPSGTCNFSRIENTKIVEEIRDMFADKRPVPLDMYKGTEVLIFCHGYNVLRVMSGMGGPAYTN